jgi:hypothetical protein
MIAQPARSDLRRDGRPARGLQQREQPDRDRPGRLPLERLGVGVRRLAVALLVRVQLALEREPRGRLGRAACNDRVLSAPRQMTGGEMDGGDVALQPDLAGPQRQRAAQRPIAPS